MPKISEGESFTAALISGIEKVWKREGWEYQHFPSKFFCLTEPKTFVGEPFCAVFRIISGTEKVLWIRSGEYQVFPCRIFCLTVPKNCVGEPFRVPLFSGSEKVYE